MLLRSSFNSLSRDHRERDVSAGDADRARRFQLPLSGSQSRMRPHIHPRGRRPFNSLSRDHLRQYSARYSSPLLNFQLPLSGSRCVAEARIWSIHDFQLPLSGSLEGLALPFSAVLRLRTFNSLSRDHRCVCSIDGSQRGDSAFQLPLSGSQQEQMLTEEDQTEQDLSFNSLSRDHKNTLKMRRSISYT